MQIDRLLILIKNWVRDKLTGTLTIVFNDGGIRDVELKNFFSNLVDCNCLNDFLGLPHENLYFFALKKINHLNNGIIKWVINRIYTLLKC